jgi:hypothetical protein
LRLFNDLLYSFCEKGVTVFAHLRCEKECPLLRLSRRQSLQSHRETTSIWRQSWERVFGDLWRLRKGLDERRTHPLKAQVREIEVEDQEERRRESTAVVLILVLVRIEGEAIHNAERTVEVMETNGREDWWLSTLANLNMIHGNVRWSDSGPLDGKSSTEIRRTLIPNPEEENVPCTILASVLLFVREGGIEREGYR